MTKINFKTGVVSLVASIFSLTQAQSVAQNDGVVNSLGKSLTIVDFDTREYGIINDIIPYVYNEMHKTKQYAVTDRYDLEFIRKRDSLDISNCYSTMCLQNLSKRFQTDYFLTGSIQRVDKKTIVSIRIFNTQTQKFDMVYNKEFVQIKGQELLMISITIQKMYGLPTDPLVEEKLTNFATFENQISNPYQMQLSAGGPRMGMVYITGQAASIIQKPTAQGGFDGSPYMFQFGYQFEKQYLNEGNFQALFEFIPMVSGLDQGRFNPSIAILNGLRNNKNGWEFAIGPSISLTQMAKGFVDSSGNFTPVDKTMPTQVNNSFMQLDSRGEFAVTTSLVLGVGKTFKSGKMNFPINIWFSPSVKSPRYGISVGWNARERYKK